MISIARLLPWPLLLATALGGCLDAKSGRVDGDTDTATAVDTASPADSAAEDASTEDVSVADASGDDVPAPSDTAMPTDTAAPLEDTGPTETGCCLVPSVLAGGEAQTLDATACAAACGTVAPATTCEAPPRCCLVPSRQNGTYAMSEVECAAVAGLLVDLAECAPPDPDLCCRWDGSPAVGIELPKSECLATGGAEIYGDYCWDGPFLDTQCCALPDGTYQFIADYECAPVHGGQATAFGRCWQPPSDGVCCAHRCSGPTVEESAIACQETDGTPADWAVCAPPGAVVAP